MPELENQNLIAERTWEQIFREAKVPSETNPIPSVRMDSVFGGRYIGVSLEGAQFKSSKSGARVEIFSDPNTGFVCYASDNSIVFKTVVGGSDVGDVVIGNFEAGHGAKWDQSAGTFTVKGNLEVNSLDIPDKVSDDSFHVDTSGNVWWGATTIDNATAKILNTGVATFRQVGTTVMGSTLSFQDIFGDGADGNVTISTNTVLTDDMFYNNLTINAGVTLYPAGYRIFVKGTLTNNGKIARDGNNGGNGENAHVQGGTVGGAGGSGLSSGSIYGSLPGKAGGNGGTYYGYGGQAGMPWPGVNGDNLVKALGNNAARGGAGGNGNGRSGGAASTGGVKTGTIYNYPRNVVSAYMLYDTLPSGDVLKTNPSAGSGGGGGAGNNFGRPDGGGGGGSGSGGGIILIFARTLINNGVISAKGGNGGNGGNGIAWGGGVSGGGGGGGGGNGGVIILCYTQKSGTGTVDVSGGIGGTGGAAGGSGATAGENGSNGVAGKVFEFVV